MQGEGHTADIAGAHGAGQGSGQGLEVGSVAFGVVAGITPGQRQPGAFEIAYLREAQVKGKEYANSEQQPREIPGGAQDSVKKGQEVIKSLHNIIL